VSILRALFGWITAACRLGQGLLGHLACFVWRENPKLAQCHSPADTAPIAVLKDEGAHAAGFDPQPEARHFIIPQEQVAGMVRLDGVHNAFCQLHSSPSAAG